MKKMEKNLLHLSRSNCITRDVQRLVSLHVHRVMESKFRIRTFDDYLQHTPESNGTQPVTFSGPLCFNFARVEM